MTDRLAEHFEAHRPRLRAVAYRMLGSLSEADDAVQESWLRLSRSDADAIDDLGAWLTTVVARIALNMLRQRRTRREQTLPDPIIDDPGGVDPEHEALLADAVGLALQVVLDTLAPAERLAFVLHDMFAVPFDDIAPIVDRSPEATRQLASRARRRVRTATPDPDTEPAVQREVVDAFFAAARDGDFEGLVAVLDPDIVLRAETAEALLEVRGAREVARRAGAYGRIGLVIQPVLVNGLPGALAWRDGQPFSIGAYRIAGGKIVELIILNDPERLRRLDLPAP